MERILWIDVGCVMLSFIFTQDINATISSGNNGQPNNSFVESAIKGFVFKLQLQPRLTPQTVYIRTW